MPSTTTCDQPEAYSLLPASVDVVVSTSQIDHNPFRTSNLNTDTVMTSNREAVTGREVVDNNLKADRDSNDNMDVHDETDSLGDLYEHSEPDNDSAPFNPQNHSEGLPADEFILPRDPLYVTFYLMHNLN